MASKEPDFIAKVMIINEFNILEDDLKEVEKKTEF